MAQKSKYSDQEFEQMLNDMVEVLTKYQASPELSLMMVGNLATHIINKNLPKSQREHMAKTFANVLLSSVDT